VTVSFCIQRLSTAEPCLGKSCAVDATALPHKMRRLLEFCRFRSCQPAGINGKELRNCGLAELDRIAMQQGADHKVDAASLQACVKTQNDAAIKAPCMKGGMNRRGFHAYAVH